MKQKLTPRFLHTLAFSILLLPILTSCGDGNLFIDQFLKDIDKDLGPKGPKDPPGGHAMIPVSRESEGDEPELEEDQEVPKEVVAAIMAELKKVTKKSLPEVVRELDEESSPPEKEAMEEAEKILKQSRKELPPKKPAKKIEEQPSKREVPTPVGPIIVKELAKFIQGLSIVTKKSIPDSGKFVKGLSKVLSETIKKSRGSVKGLSKFLGETIKKSRESVEESKTTEIPVEKVQNIIRAASKKVAESGTKAVGKPRKDKKKSVKKVPSNKITEPVIVTPSLEDLIPVSEEDKKKWAGYTSEMYTIMRLGEQVLEAAKTANNAERISKFLNPGCKKCKKCKECKEKKCEGCEKCKECKGLHSYINARFPKVKITKTDEYLLKAILKQAADVMTTLKVYKDSFRDLPPEKDVIFQTLFCDIYLQEDKIGRTIASSETIASSVFNALIPEKGEAYEKTDLRYKKIQHAIQELKDKKVFKKQAGKLQKRLDGKVERDRVTSYVQMNFDNEALDEIVHEARKEGKSEE